MKTKRKKVGHSVSNCCLNPIKSSFPICHPTDTLLVSCVMSSHFYSQASSCPVNSMLNNWSLPLPWNTFSHGFQDIPLLKNHSYHISVCFSFLLSSLRPLLFSVYIEWLSISSYHMSSDTLASSSFTSPAHSSPLNSRIMVTIPYIPDI